MTKHERFDQTIEILPDKSESTAAPITCSGQNLKLLKWEEQEQQQLLNLKDRDYVSRSKRINQFIFISVKENMRLTNKRYDLI